MNKFITVFVLLFLAGGSYGQTQLVNGSLSACPEPAWNNAVARLIYDKLDAFRVKMETGAPALGIPPLDPLGPLPSLSFSIDNEYLRLDGSVNDTLVTNLSKYIICEIMFEFGLRQEFYLDLRLDDFHMGGLYDLSGTYVQIFPIFGSGNYTLDTFNASINGGAKISYNVLTDHAQIKNLELDIVFEELELFLECILGCGQMADTINEYLGEIATAIFESIWEAINPILTEAIENGVNYFLKDVKITDLLPGGNTTMEDYFLNWQPVETEGDTQKINIEIPLYKLLKPGN